MARSLFQCHLHGVFFTQKRSPRLVPDPGYPGYAATARIAGAESVFYDLSEENGWLPDLDELGRRDMPDVKIMWINYPHMPSGAPATREQFEGLIAFARRQNILICHDNPYSLILNKSEPLSILAIGAFDCCLELNSLSKSHNMAGWRLGMVTGKEDYIRAILAVKTNVDSGMFLPIQHAAIAALYRRYHRRKRLIYALLDVMGFHYREGMVGMFVWARAPNHIREVNGFLDELLYGAGVFITPGSVFGKNGKRYIRVSTCASEQKIMLASSRVQHYLQGRS